MVLIIAAMPLGEVAAPGDHVDHLVAGFDAGEGQAFGGLALGVVGAIGGGTGRIVDRGLDGGRNRGLRAGGDRHQAERGDDERWTHVAVSRGLGGVSLERDRFKRGHPEA
jgi:hypothetical protein